MHVRSKFRVIALCLISLALGITLWLTQIDAAISTYLEATTPQWLNTTWRIIGELGLGRTQLFICLILGWVYAGKPPFLYTTFQYFTGAFYIWLRLLVLKTAPIEHANNGFQRAAVHVQNLPYKAKAWVMAIPVMFGAGVLCTIIKILAGRPRPKEFLWNDIYWHFGPTLNAVWHSFPSGHTTTTFALLAVIERIYTKPWQRMVLWVIASTMAFARVGAVTPHYLGDVLAGVALGYGVGVALAEKFKIKNNLYK